ncbi:cellulose binding domain-containing protein [Phytohabitans rumicis]|nr:cellulose binding domain-containing protein [Phytohabitans rumicis]
MRAPRRRTTVAGALAAGMLAMGGFAVTTAVASAAVTGCRVDYRITNQWTGGFGADVAITNLGDPVTGWALTWTFAAGQSVTQAWNATVAQSGTAVTATNVSYNGAIATNGSVSFGFNGAWTSSNPVPAAFAVNGTPCTGTPNATPCPAPVTPTPGTPTPAPTTSAPQSRVTVWLAGDSTVANPASSGACPVGWGNQFASYFNSNVTVVNSAIGGRSIQTWLYDPNVTSTMNSAGECVVSPQTYSTRWQAMLNASTGMKAGDYLFIQFGINDGSTTCPRHVGSAKYRELLGVMASAAKARGAYPVFLTPAAAITCSGSTATGNRAS